VARVSAALAAAVIVLYAAVLLVIGTRWVGVPAGAPGDPPGPPRVEHRPFPLAVVPLAAALLVLIGLLQSQRRPMAWALMWTGAAALLVFAAVTIFSAGLVLLPAGGALLILLAVLALIPPHRSDSPQTARASRHRAAVG
jgi:hypothetical protein